MSDIPQEPGRIPEWHGVDRRTFHDEIVPLGRPAVLRGVVRDWPSVRHAVDSPEAIGRYLAGLDSGSEHNAVLVPPEWSGRMFYRPDLSDFNFSRNNLSVSAVLQRLARYSHFERPPAVALQSAPIATCLPGFLETNRLPLLDDSVLPRIWMGNAFLTPAHIDELDNIACVVSGRRRFTLFPPEQVGNLYIGPFEFTPAGAPVSMVSLKEPDFERYPRFRHALAAAQVADLEPGDALFIPAVWWHHVESMDAVSILVNYWWEQVPRADAGARISPTKSLVHALLSIKDLPPAHRAAWGEMFAHFVFSPDDDRAAHIPEHRRGVLGELPADRIDAMLGALGTRGKPA